MSSSPPARFAAPGCRPQNVPPPPRDVYCNDCAGLRVVLWSLGFLLAIRPTYNLCSSHTTMSVIQVLSGAYSADSFTSCTTMYVIQLLSATNSADSITRLSALIIYYLIINYNYLIINYNYLIINYLIINYLIINYLHFLKTITESRFQLE